MKIGEYMHGRGRGFKSHHSRSYQSQGESLGFVVTCDEVVGLERRSWYTRRPKGVLVSESGEEVLNERSEFRNLTPSPITRAVSKIALYGLSAL